MVHAALQIPCPTCTVPIGEECITIQFDQPKPRPPHGSRLKEAKEKGLSKPRGGPSRAVHEKRPEVVQEYPEDYPGPMLVDYIMYHDPATKTQGHTGRVLEILFGNKKGNAIDKQKIEGVVIRVRPTPSLGEDVPWEAFHENDTEVLAKNVIGWWPYQMDESRTTKNMRKFVKWY